MISMDQRGYPLPGFNPFCQRLRGLGIFNDPICKKIPFLLTHTAFGEPRLESKWGLYCI